MFTKNNCKIKGGFTLIELLVVISIIALLAALSLKGIARSVANAKINKAVAEMTSLASTGATIYIDLKSRGYVPLADYALVKTVTVPALGTPSTPRKLIIAAGGYTENDFTTSDFVDNTDFQNHFDGPYTVWQTGTVSTAIVSGTNGPPTIVGGTGWTASATFFPVGTPLDPWKHCYGLGWDTTKQVMIIYSAGPDGIMQTVWGATTVAAGNDDRLYQFR